MADKNSYKDTYYCPTCCKVTSHIVTDSLDQDEYHETDRVCEVCSHNAHTKAEQGAPGVSRD